MLLENARWLIPLHEPTNPVVDTAKAMSGISSLDVADISVALLIGCVSTDMLGTFVVDPSAATVNPQVVLVLDMREQLSRVHTSGPGAMSKSDNLMMHVNAIRAKGVAVEVKHLAVGDALWLARCR